MLTAAALASSAATAQVKPPEGKATGDEVRMKLEYLALVRRKRDGGPAALEKVKLRPFGGRQVLVRLTAVQCCYSETAQVLGGRVQSVGPNGTPIVCGHQGIGIVEAIGPAVRSVQPGDKVFINVTANCGWCYNCVRGRADVCLANRLPNPIIGELSDGTPVMQDTGGGGIGGLSEYTVNYEERLTPVWTKVSDAELAFMNCVGSTGLGMTCTLHPIESGSSVVVFGAGPIGLSAVQGAKIQGATRIISVEPIKMRRDMALKMGATDVVDPNEFGDKLVDHLRDMTIHTPIDRLFSGARELAPNGRGGPDYVIEAVGRQQATPKVEQGPDPTGVQAVEQVWTLVPPGSYGFTAGFGYAADDVVKLPAGQFTNGSKTMISSQGGGTQARRDLPRFAQLMETGKFDAKSLITKTYKLTEIHKAYQEVADRTVISNMITF
jgi:S-(hydroxymethyl)glutathione dehydrogenase/alcohol dehydrogenase